MRRGFELSDQDLQRLYDAAKPVPYMVVGGVAPRTPQENANAVWRDIGRKMGFDYMTVRPVQGKGHRHFTAEESE